MTSAPDRQDMRPANTTINPDEFRSAFRNHAAGVAVITADLGDGPVALTATSVVSVSAEPPILAFSLSASSSASPSIKRASTVVVHLLTDRDLALAQLCSTSGADRFSNSAVWSRLDGGEPVFHLATRWLRCRVLHRVEPDGGSTLIVASVMDAGGGQAEGGQPLVYYDRQWHGLSGASRLN
ncbi:flavin reductase family protein [Ruicaihuangia caeni]|uniref:flavin reductase family protein n=1 Tax=Ruicaihuangia caeni TaxID=3042517 RepID=UPI00338E1975